MEAQHQEVTYRILREIIAATEQAAQDTLPEDVLPTAADIARHLKLRVEFVKKRLLPLKDAELIQPVGMNPKRYRFNTFAFNHLTPDDSLYEVFCEPDSPFFLQLCR